MRDELKPFINSEITVTGIFNEYGRDQNKKSREATFTKICFQNIKDISGKEVCEHVWVDKKYFSNFVFRKGQKVKFSGMVSEYPKIDGKKDYCFENIKNIEKLIK